MKELNQEVKHRDVILVTLVTSAPMTYSIISSLDMIFPEIEDVKDKIKTKDLPTNSIMVEDSNVMTSKRMCKRIQLIF